MESKRFGMSRRNFVKLSGATGILSVAGLAACGNSGSSSAGSSTTFKLGNIGPLTGGAAIYGNATKNGAQLAVDEINAAGGSIQFEHNCQDDEHDPEKSVNAYNNLKDWGLQVLVGPTTTNPCVAVSAETNSDNVFELTPSASSNDVIGGQEDADGNVTTARKDNVFQMCFTDPNQGTASAQYLAKKQLGTKIAVIYNNSDAYSAGVYKKFEAEAANQGLQIVSTSTFTDDNATDFSVQLNDAKNNGADLVFLPIYYTPAALILTQANGMGYAPDFFGCDEKTSAFTKAYKDAYGDDPIQFAADAYDCVYVIKELLEKTGCTPDMSASDICDKLKAAIVDGYTYSGLTGENMSWKDTGEVSKEPKGMVIKDGVYQPLD